MEQWIRRNQVALPWALLGANVTFQLALQIYKVYRGTHRDGDTFVSPAVSLLPKLADAEIESLPYPPDAYPRARDVTSPYGSLRVYEWGPQDGAKVLLVHGITNPCVSLGAVAQGLVDHGYRVILFDLPGRGYSSAPVETPQSDRLFTTCILLALTSSPLTWVGDQQFSLIGYSLGGGIAVNFASYFPRLVSSLVLLAPAGLVRTYRITTGNRILYDSGLLGESWLERIVTNRLKSGAPPVRAIQPKAQYSPSAEVPAEKENPPPLSLTRPDINPSKVVPWQVDANQGFVKSYISSMRYGPIKDQHHHWRRLGLHFNERKTQSDAKRSQVLIIAGQHDVLIDPNELTPDATEVLGSENVTFKYVNAGHDLPVTRSIEIVRFIREHVEK